MREVRRRSSGHLSSLCYLKSCCLDNNFSLYGWLNNGWLDLDLNLWLNHGWLDQWLHQWLDVLLGLLGHIALVVGSLVWLGDSLQTKEFLLETLQLATDGNHISAAAALEWLADDALFLSTGSLEDEFVLSVSQALDCWVEEGLNISRVHWTDLSNLGLACLSGNGECHHKKGDDDLGVHGFLRLDRPRIQM